MSAADSTVICDVRAVIRRPADGHWLLLRGQQGGATVWALPGGPIRAGEDPASGLRRLCAAQLGFMLDDVGACRLRRWHAAGRLIEYRYFLVTCHAAEADAAVSPALWLPPDSDGAVHLDTATALAWRYGG